MRTLGAILFGTMAAWSHYCWAGYWPTEEISHLVWAVFSALTI